MLLTKVIVPYFVQECLQYDTPVIVTDVGGCTELIKDGINGYVIPLDMNFDINKIKKIPIVKDYDNGVSAKTWCDYIGGAVYVKKPLTEIIENVSIKVLIPYDDIELKRITIKGETLTITKERYEDLMKKIPDYIELIE